ncbi:MAG TPA: TrbI/VirB10 family protein [Candidatus Sulfopaludibacter sp.]|nr:TrbI/VirB10 family protein [Candidatus Sulfopaludibacter sp.]
MPLAMASQTSTTVPQGTAIQITLNNALGTKTSAQGDPFTATVSAPVFSANGMRQMIPQGSTISGRVASVQKSGSLGGKSQLQLEFQALHLPDGTSLPLRAEVSQVNTKHGVGAVVTGSPSASAEGGVQQSQSRKTAGSATAGGVAGAAIGAIAGGGKGAAIGLLSGAGLGVLTAAVKGGDINLPAGTSLTIVLDSPLNLR